MRSTHTQKCTLPFGYIADILFQVIINGEASTILTLCLLNKSTYLTIKLLEPHIGTWFMRQHGIGTFDPLLTLDPWTGQQHTLTVHTLVRSLYRHGLARRLSLHIVPAVWGPFYDDDRVEMNYEAELKLARRLERGLHVLFHMADIARDTRGEDERERQSPHKGCSLSALVSQRLAILTRLLDEYSEFESRPSMNSDMNFNFPPLGRYNPRKKPNHQQNNDSSPRILFPDQTQIHHLSRLLAKGHTESLVGARRLAFRSHLDESTEIAFHCTLRMLRELLERMLLRHGPKLWYRDTRDEYSVTSWFLLNQGPRNLARLFLPDEGDGQGCCAINYTNTSTSPVTAQKCLLSDPLDAYWDAWRDINNPLETKHASTNLDSYAPSQGLTSPFSAPPSPSPTRLTLSWSVKPTLSTNRGREFNRAAERYLKEMWGKRHVGLHEAFTVGVFASVL
ncbi:uncharacterized protein BDV14DRAFT_76454 [Aspergillus stella-maris]|uniref:uncharacterized protein n=1 Tax=Aspergillus stella-maris TaxID=1810926 RepID=UPI003CCCE9CF